MRRIAVDAMGTDTAPLPEVEGAILAARERHAQVLLVGPQDLLKRELGRRDARGLGIEVVHASEAVTMEDAAAKAFRRKRDSSIRVAARNEEQPGLRSNVGADDHPLAQCREGVTAAGHPDRGVSGPHRYAVLLGEHGGGRLTVDYGRLHDVEPVS